MDTEEKSIELAESINDIKMILFLMDTEHAKEVAIKMKQQANFQDSAAVLNPSYNPEKSELLRKQSEMLMHLVSYVEIGKEVDNLKKSISQHDTDMNKIQKLFI